MDSVITKAGSDGATGRQSIVAFTPINQNDQFTITIVMAGRAHATHHHYCSYHDYYIIL